MFSFFQSAPSGPSLSATDAVAQAGAGDVIVVDVREFNEVAMSGKAKGAIHVPLSRLQDFFDPRHPDHNKKLTPDAKIALYCASGARSGHAASALRQFGYSDVHNIGGLGHWVQAGGEIERL